MNAKQHDTKALQDLDKQHYMHPFTDSKAMHKKGTRIMTGAFVGFAGVTEPNYEPCRIRQVRN